MMMRRLKTAAIAALLMSMTAAHAQMIPVAPGTGIPYASVAEALAALRVKDRVHFWRASSGWIMAKDINEQTIWSFTPDDHYAHPSVGRRRFVERDGRLYQQNEIRCDAEKAACDRLQVDYPMLDSSMNPRVRQPE
jgi:hypothetical protein